MVLQPEIIPAKKHSSHQFWLDDSKLDNRFEYFLAHSSKIVKNCHFIGQCNYFYYFPPKMFLSTILEINFWQKRLTRFWLEKFIIDSIGSKVKSQNYSTRPDSTVNGSGGSWLEQFPTRHSPNTHHYWVKWIGGEKSFGMINNNISSLKNQIHLPN